MKKTLFTLIAMLLLTACAPKAQPTAQDVLNSFTEAGAQIENITEEARDSNSPLPNSYQEHYSFSIAEVAPSGGQIFVCDTKKNCDALYQYFDMLSGLGGPYYYQSPSGLIVAQLNSGLTPDTAAKFETVVNTYK